MFVVFCGASGNKDVFVLFDNKQLHPSGFIISVKEFIYDCENAILPADLSTPGNEEIVWKPPNEHYLKLNFNASFISVINLRIWSNIAK